MKRTFLITSISFLLLFITLTSFAPAESAGLVNDVFRQTNKFRRSKGLSSLEINADLNEIAQKHSVNMARGRVGFGHGGFTKRDAMARKKIKGMRSFAENVAYGATTGKQVVTMWKNSSGHRKNMLGRYKYIGIGIAKNRKGTIFYTQVFAD